MALIMAGRYIAPGLAESVVEDRFRGLGIANVKRLALAAAVAVAVGASLAVGPARAQDCPGNPDALGTSRVLAVDPAQFPRVGRMQYPQSLPLADKEVVLTFDDGPLPPYSNQILDILASQCVKATYFLVGSMARAYPATARRIYEQGHTVGTHSENHPSRFGKLPIERMRQEIDGGIADVGAALGDPQRVAPFFRIPGLDRSDTVESELAARSLIVFSSDTVADDWHHRITPGQIVSLALSRLEARGKGILLLHDIHPKTVAALPSLLKALKDNGFHIVQVVPAATDQVEVAARSGTRVLASAMPEDLMIDDGIDNDAGQARWPQASDNLAPDDIALPAPDAAAFAPDAGLSVDDSEARWPAAAEVPAPHDANDAAHFRHSAADRVSEHERLRLERHPHRREHGRAHAGGERHRADLISGIQAIAALFSPARPTP
jgi:peptidoglycan/xylan/chitin deacetylase (PgdA/CDA1 family)